MKPWYVFGWSGGADLLRRERVIVAAEVDVQNLQYSSSKFVTAGAEPVHPSRCCPETCPADAELDWPPDAIRAGAKKVTSLLCHCARKAHQLGSQHPVLTFWHACKRSAATAEPEIRDQEKSNRLLHRRRAA